LIFIILFEEPQNSFFDKQFWGAHNPKKKKKKNMIQIWTIP